MATWVKGPFLQKFGRVKEKRNTFLTFFKKNFTPKLKFLRKALPKDYSNLPSLNLVKIPLKP